MTEREFLESVIREAFQIGKASANEHIAFSSTAIAVEALIQRTAMQARATPALPQGVEEWIHHHWVQFDTAKFERFVPVDDLTAYLSGMAIVPVEISKFIEDREAIEGVLEWASNEEQTVNIGWVQSDQDEHLESSAGWVTRFLTAMLAAAKEKGE